MRVLSNVLLAIVSLCALAVAVQGSGTRSLNHKGYTPKGNLARDHDTDPSPALQSAIAPERERVDVSSDRRHIIARRVAGSESDLGKRWGCSPGCWWNETAKECNCCPKESTKCQGGGCCGAGSYCVKIKTGKEACCPNGQQCSGVSSDGHNRDKRPQRGGKRFKCARST